MTSASKIAEDVADLAGQVADNLFLYMAAGAGAQDRADFLTRTEPLIGRLNEAWFRLGLQHKLEAFNARVDGIDKKENLR